MNSNISIYPKIRIKQPRFSDRDPTIKSISITTQLLNALKDMDNIRIIPIPTPNQATIVPELRFSYTPNPNTEGPLSLNGAQPNSQKLRQFFHLTIEYLTKRKKPKTELSLILHTNTSFPQNAYIRISSTSNSPKTNTLSIEIKLPTQNNPHNQIECQLPLTEIRTLSLDELHTLIEAVYDKKFEALTSATNIPKYVVEIIVISAINALIHHEASSS